MLHIVITVILDEHLDWTKWHWKDQGSYWYCNDPFQFDQNRGGGGETRRQFCRGN